MGSTGDAACSLPCPLVGLPCDPEGSDALRELAAEARDPLEALAAEGEASEEVVRAVLELHDAVERAKQDRVPPGRRACDRALIAKVGARGGRHSAAMARLAALAGVYELLGASGAVRAWSAQRRRVDIDQLGGRKTPRALQAYYVAFPCFLFMAGFFVQSLLSHLATYLYILHEVPKHHGRHGADGHDVLFDVVGQWAGREGTEPLISVHALDMTGVVPMMLWLASYCWAAFRGEFSIGLWNKTLLVAACMAVVKGVFDVVTILPDSSGWHTCKERLGNDGFQRVRHLDLFGSWFQSLGKLLQLEIFGGEGHQRIRYCADMLVSGHAYFAVLFSLSAYRQVCLAGGWAGLVGAVCLCCVCVNVTLVALARFHYTVDLLAAILLVFLLFDSACVDQLAVDWSEGFSWREPGFEPKSSPLLRRALRAPPATAPADAAAAELEAAPLLNGHGGAVLPSRPPGLVNLRVAHGCAPWSWRVARVGPRGEAPGAPPPAEAALGQAYGATSDC